MLASLECVLLQCTIILHHTAYLAIERISLIVFLAHSLPYLKQVSCLCSVRYFLACFRTFFPNTFSGNVNAPPGDVTQGAWPVCIHGLDLRKYSLNLWNDGSSPCAQSGSPGLVLRAPDGAAGLRAAGSAEHRDPGAGTTGEQRDRVHRGALFTFCVVHGDASDSKRIGGGDV